MWEFVSHSHNRSNCGLAVLASPTVPTQNSLPDAPDLSEKTDRLFACFSRYSCWPLRKKWSALVATLKSMAHHFTRRDCSLVSQTLSEVLIPGDLAKYSSLHLFAPASRIAVARWSDYASQ